MLELLKSIMATSSHDILNEVLERDGNACTFCLAPDHTSVLRMNNPERYMVRDSGDVFNAANGERVGHLDPNQRHFGQSVRIVLNLGYMDGDHSNVGVPGDRLNVVVLCQHCMNRHRETAELGPLLPGIA